MNLAEIRAHTFARCGWDAQNPGQTVINRIDGFINETYRSIMAKKGLETLRRHVVNWSSNPNRSMTTMPTCVTRIYNLWDIEHGTVLRDLSVQDVRRADPKWGPFNQLGETGNPMGYAVYNLNTAAFVQPWEIAPQTGLYMQCASSSALDTSSTLVNVQGVNTAGHPVTASAALNGTTATIPFVSSWTWAIVTKFFLSSATDPQLLVPVAQGEIALAGNYPGPGTPVTPQTYLSLIPAGRKAAHYSAINLYPTPSVAVALSADCDIVSEDLVVAGDQPILPFDFHPLLVIGAAIKEYARREKSQQLVLLQREYNDLLADLMVYANRQVSELRQAPAGLGRGWGRSQLGSMYPAGS